MNIQTFVTVPLLDILSTIGLNDSVIDETFDDICDAIEEETDVPAPEEHESFTIVLTDDDLLILALKKAKVNKKKFDEAIALISKENNDLPVYVTF